MEDQDIGTVTNVSGKFLLRIPRATDQTVIVFQHVGYDTLKRSVADLQINSNIFLTERIIPLPAIEVEATREKIEIEKDLPQTVTLFEARQFELKGFIDAGDLLQGQPPVYYYNFEETNVPHLIAEVMNFMKYDAGAGVLHT